MSLLISKTTLSSINVDEPLYHHWKSSGQCFELFAVKIVIRFHSSDYLMLFHSNRNLTLIIPWLILHMFVMPWYILVLYLENVRQLGRSNVTKILVSSKVGSRPCDSLMWARLSVCPSSDVAPVFSVTTVGKQTMNKHKLDVIRHSNGRKGLVKGRRCRAIYGERDRLFVFYYHCILSYFLSY